jgi:hypothetical protein
LIAPDPGPRAQPAAKNASRTATAATGFTVYLSKLGGGRRRERLRSIVSFELP